MWTAWRSYVGGGRRAPGPSVLFERARAQERVAPPPCFRDLNLDQVVDAIASRREEHELEPIFHMPLDTVGEVVYRQEVMRDMEGVRVAGCVERFSERMRRLRGSLAVIARLERERQREVWCLDAAALYCEAVKDLYAGLTQAEPRSRGLRAMCEYLAGYMRGDEFDTLAGESERCRRRLGEIRYTLSIRQGGVRVGGYDGEVDYGAEIERTFARFAQGAVRDHRARFGELLEMGHVEAAVLELVARLHPDPFAQLREFCANERRYLDPVVVGFDRDIQFYVSYLAYIAPLRRAGLSFCYPELSGAKRERVRDAYDLALAHKLLERGQRAVGNDWHLDGQERIFVVSGPNQGGKTTFARTFGQLHHLASLGCPVPGARAQLLHCDRVLTHFEQRENLASGHGKLEDDLIRVHEILQQATARTVIVMNESFTSTTLADARLLGAEVLSRMIAREVLGVYVTFVDELASLGESVVSATSTVEPHDPAIRTYKIVRRDADGLAYAAAIAEKYGLGYRTLRRRVGR